MDQPNRTFGLLLWCAALACSVGPASAGEAPEPRGTDKAGEAGADAKLLADLEILRDLEMLRQLDVLWRVDEARNMPSPRQTQEVIRQRLDEFRKLPPEERQRIREEFRARQPQGAPRHPPSRP